MFFCTRLYLKVFVILINLILTTLNYCAHSTLEEAIVLKC